MNNQKKKEKAKKICWIVGSIALTAVGFSVVPRLIDKYGNKMYKKSITDTEININDMAPEIVKKETKNEVETND